MNTWLITEKTLSYDISEATHDFILFFIFLANIIFYVENIPVFAGWKSSLPVILL